MTLYTALLLIGLGLWIFIMLGYFQLLLRVIFEKKVS